MYNILLEDGGFAKIENAVELGMLPKETTFPWVYSLRIRNLAVCRELIPEITFEKAKKWLGTRIFDICREQRKELQEEIYKLEANFNFAQELFADEW